MSNYSILQRLESKFEDFLQRKVSTEEFTTFLTNSIDALEAVDYNEVQVARDFQYKFEIANFHDEDPEIDSLDKVTNDFKEWIKTLKQKNYR